MRLARSVVATVAGSAVLWLASGCAEEQPDAPADDVSSNVVLDSAELRAQKQAAGIEDCPTSKHLPPATDALPDLMLPCLGGGPAVDLSTLSGPLVINLWAQWCKPCREELPLYQRLHEEGRGKVEVIGIDYLDPQPGGALALAAETGVTFPLLADPDGDLRTELRINGLPGVVFVDADGKVTKVAFLVVESYAQLRGLVREHLGLDV